MGKYESLLGEVRKHLHDLAPLLIEAGLELMVERMLNGPSTAAAKPGKNVAQRKAKKKRPYTRIDDTSILNVLRDKGPLRIVDIHKVVGGSVSNVAKRVGVLKEAGTVQEVFIADEKRIKLTRDGRGRQTALPASSAKPAVAAAAAKTTSLAKPNQTAAKTTAVAKKTGHVAKAVRSKGKVRRQGAPPESAVTEKAPVAANENAA